MKNFWLNRKSGIIVITLNPNNLKWYIYRRLKGTTYYLHNDGTWSDSPLRSTHPYEPSGYYATKDKAQEILDHEELLAN